MLFLHLPHPPNQPLLPHQHPQHHQNPSHLPTTFTSPTQSFTTAPTALLLEQTHHY